MPMMRLILLTLLLMAGQHALAADPMVITLSCNGTRTDTSSTSLPIDREPKPVEKMGVVANFNERTVSFMGFVAPISSDDAASVNFDGEQLGPVAQIASKAGYATRIDGYLDRVTGHMIADISTYPIEKSSDSATILGGTKDHYDALCKATNRAF